MINRLPINFRDFQKPIKQDCFGNAFQERIQVLKLKRECTWPQMN
jgi:hypothetical protein